jgi:hypothetical protein
MRVTVNEQDVELPHKSIAVYVMVVVDPLANVEPGAGPVLVIVTTPLQLSVAVGTFQLAVEVHADRTIFDGHALKTGAILSFTTIV